MISCSNPQFTTNALPHTADLSSGIIQLETILLSEHQRAIMAAYFHFADKMTYSVRVGQSKAYAMYMEACREMGFKAYGLTKFKEIRASIPFLKMQSRIMNGTTIFQFDVTAIKAKLKRFWGKCVTLAKTRMHKKGRTTLRLREIEKAKYRLKPATARAESVKPRDYITKDDPKKDQKNISDSVDVLENEKRSAKKLIELIKPSLIDSTATSEQVQVARKAYTFLGYNWNFNQYDDFGLLVWRPKSTTARREHWEANKHRYDAIKALKSRYVANESDNHGLLTEVCFD